MTEAENSAGPFCSLNFIVAVVQRGHSEEYAKFFRRSGANLIYSCLCEGTAQKKMLSLWGIEKKERLAIFCLCPGRVADGIMKRLVTEMRIDAPNEGVALMLPVESVAGVMNVKYDPGAGTDKEFTKRVAEMRYSLIVSIAEKGRVDKVMDAARSAGARGGTVIHAKGTGARLASKFLGVTVAEEKEMIYIVAGKESEEAVVRAIAQEDGPDSGSGTIAFVLPVERIAGFSKL